MSKEQSRTGLYIMVGLTLFLTCENNLTSSRLDKRISHLESTLNKLNSVISNNHEKPDVYYNSKLPSPTTKPYIPK